ncbi:MAG: hypothetical protein ACRBK7_21940 [Acidimicrobiales bacterium]
MADRDSSYIAWDGVLYEGSPPSGWYLAADNRWWPPQEMIESGGQAPNDPYDAHQDETLGGAPTHDQGPDDQTFGSYTSDPSTSGADRPGNADYQTPSPPESWAPHSGTGDGASQSRPEQRPPPILTPGVGPQRRPQRRSGRRGGFRPGFMIPLVVFGLLRCSSGFDSGPATVEFPDEPFEIENPFEEEGSFAIGDNWVEFSGEVDLYIEITDCGPTDISLLILNTGPDEAGGTFDVDLWFSERNPVSPELDGEAFMVEWRGFATGEPIETTLPIPDQVGLVGDCQVLDAAVQQI